MPVSEAEIAPWLVSLALTYLPLSLLWVGRPVGSQLVYLWYLLNSLFSFWREWAVFLVAWWPLLAFRNCFVRVAQLSNDVLMNLLGRKWTPSPTSLSPWDCSLGSCLCTYSASLGLLIGTFNTFIFKVIIDIFFSHCHFINCLELIL